MTSNARQWRALDSLVSVVLAFDLWTARPQTRTGFNHLKEPTSLRADDMVIATAAVEG